MRNHNTLKRDAIIKQVAGLVGQPHKVDLKNYDLLIVVEIYQVRSIASSLSLIIRETDPIPHTLTLLERTCAALVSSTIASRNSKDTTSPKSSILRPRKR